MINIIIIIPIWILFSIDAVVTDPFTVDDKLEIVLTRR